MLFKLIALPEQDLTSVLWCLQHAAISVELCSVNQVITQLMGADGYILTSSCTHNNSLTPFLSAAAAQGSPILGIGPGALSLVELGLIPGLPGNKIITNLTVVPFKTESAVDDYLHLTQDYQYNAFTRNLSLQDKIPISGHENRQFAVPPGLLLEIEAQGLNVLQYYQRTAIAALGNKAGNIMALLPCLAPNINSAAIFISMSSYVKEKGLIPTQPLHYWPR